MKMLIAGAVALCVLAGGALAQPYNPDRGPEPGYNQQGYNQPGPPHGDHHGAYDRSRELPYDARRADEGGHHQRDGWRGHHRHRVCVWRHHQRYCRWGW